MKTAHFTPPYLLANCRRLVSDNYRTKPNWVLASELFAIGSNSAHKICRDWGIDPDGVDVRPVTQDKKEIQK